MNHQDVNLHPLSTLNHTVLLRWVLSKFHYVFHLRVAVYSKKAQNGIFLVGDSIALLWNSPWDSAQCQTSSRLPGMTKQAQLLCNITDTNLSLASREGISWKVIKSLPAKLTSRPSLQRAGSGKMGFFYGAGKWNLRKFPSTAIRKNRTIAFFSLPN